MGKRDLHILMLEDDPMDAELNRAQLLLLDEYNCIVEWVLDRESYLKGLKSCPDLILSDFSLPQYNGLEALKDLKEQSLIIPFIFVTGTINEETAVDTIKAGAWDYVVKDRLFRLPLAIRNVLKLKEERINTNKVEQLNRKLSMAVEQSPVHIIITNIQGKIEYVNARFTEVTGFTPGEVIGKDPRVFIPGNFTDEHIGELWEDLKSGQSWRGEAQSHKKDGTTYWEYISISPLKDEDGEITHFIAVKEDISQRKIMEQELIAALDRAERSDKLKEVFLQNLSHEIRTPLNAIVGFSGLLNDPGTQGEQQRDFKNIILESSHQLLSIVSDVLTVSRIQTGQEELVFKPANVDSIMDNVKIIFQSRVQSKGLLFIVKKPEVPGLVVLTDETKLVQVLTNLLTNAVKFTHKGYIEFGCTWENKTLNFYVKDTGIGIENEHLESIFERFRQADASISINYGGTGLGLSISRSFAEMLGGSISVASQIGVGSTFIFSLPCEKSSTKRETKTIEKPTMSSKKFTILIAEDEEYNYQLIEIFLTDQGYKLLHARNGKEAVDLYRENPDTSVVLMDIKMPVMDGKMALAEIRKLSNVPVIAQTAYALEHERQYFLSIGFDDYISKPLKKELLLEKINNFLLKYHEVV